jgi:hypothetical protein
LVLGIETSCDETGVALYETGTGLLAHEVFTQIDMHRVYGGVVPELASRDHVRRVVPLAREVLASAGRALPDLTGIAYTAGPGLIGALLVGAGVAQALAFALGIPALGVHHMEAHLLAPMLEPDPPDFPFLALLVSGGHTMLVDVAALGCYRVLGESLDDAAGEAFDKTAKLQPADSIARQLRDLTKSSLPDNGDTDTAPPVKPPTVASEKLVGTWVSDRGKDGKVTFTMVADGNYTWSYMNEGKSTDLKGTYGLNDKGLLVLSSDDSQMVSEVTMPDDKQLQFVLIGAPDGDPGLTFAKN